MIVVELKGGLGNQMFQYAVARSLLKNSGDNIWLDLNFLSQNSISRKDFKARKLELDIFCNIRAQKLNGFRYRLIYDTGLVFKFFRKIIYSIKTINQQENEFVSGLLNNVGNIYLSGYFQ